MKIERDENNLIIKIPLEQDDYDALNNFVGKIDNVIGVIAGDEQGFCGLSSRTYKGVEPDITDFIVKTAYEDDEFEKLCTKLGIGFYRYALCSKCKEPIYGCCTVGDDGFICFSCSRDS